MEKSKPILGVASAVLATASICGCWYALANGLASDEEDNTILRAPFELIFQCSLIFAGLGMAAAICALWRKEGWSAVSILGALGSTPGVLAILLFVYTHLFGPIHV